jgi:cyclopropane fatty-acyl-phospholipid synthase-like methyltransferase
MSPAAAAARKTIVMREMYEQQLYAEKNPTWHEEDAPWKAGHIERMLRKHDLPTDRICEVGCGTGEILLALERAFPRASLAGFEISPHAYGRAKKKETSRTKFHLRDASEIPEAFDVALAIDVFEHVEDYMGFIKRVRSLARYKIFHIPLDLSVQSVFRASPILGLRDAVGHVHYFFKQTALATIEDCGCRVLDFHYTPSRLELPNQAFTSRLMKLPRRLMFGIDQDLAVRLLGGYSLLVLAK